VERASSICGNDLPNLTNSPSISGVAKQSGRPLLNHRHQPHLPRGDDRERITSARQAAEALFTPKPAEPSVSDPVPSVEHPVRKPRVLSILSPAPVRNEEAEAPVQPRAPDHASDPAVRTCAHPNLGAVRVDDPPSRRGLRGRRRRDRAHPPANLTNRFVCHGTVAQPTVDHVMFYMNESATQQVRRRCPVRRRRPRAPRRSSARRADRPAAGCASPQLLSSRRSSIRGCQSPGAGRCITAPGKVSGSRRFYVIIRGTAWSGGAVATATADAPEPTFSADVTVAGS
jgi:hypothetical protein